MSKPVSADVPRDMVLLVDDLPANLHVLIAALKKDYRIKTATSGLAALEIMAQFEDRPKLVILDVKMPGMSGIEVLGRFRRDEHMRDIPVILLSADASEYSELEGLNLGADDYLVKPVAASVLSVRVRNLIQRSADRSHLRLAAHVFEFSGEAVMICDSRRLIVDVNAAFTTVTGYDKSEAVGKDFTFLSSGRTTPEEYDSMMYAIDNDGFWQGEMWDRRKDGCVFPTMMTISVVVDWTGQPEFYLVNFVDVTRYKESEKKIEHVARHDALTGLPNRLYLQVFLEQSMLLVNRMYEQMAVMFLDLDRFKNINDSLGHPMGDELLIQVASRLSACTREYDMVARLGGDEFVVVLRGKDLAPIASAVAEKILYQVNQPFHIGNHTLHTAASIGISLYPENAECIEDLMRNADTAMYFSKSHGGNDFHFFSDLMNSNAYEKLELENQLHEAIERQQLELYFQPQIALHGERLIGTEVLLRWRHPDKGFISPAKFIPIAEESNLIIKIGEWVLERACYQGKQWIQEAMPALRIAVNVSAKQFQQKDFIEVVRRILTQTGFPAERLELEITESAVLSSPGDVRLMLQELRESHVQIALDDFGTGYTSLGQLRQLPLDRLKIDASFVRDITNEPGHKGGVIAAATIGLAHNLGFEVIAEGVETEMQLAFLSRHGCDEIQGYYYGKPMPANEFEAFARQRTS